MFYNTLQDNCAGDKICPSGDKDEQTYKLT